MYVYIYIYMRVCVCTGRSATCGGCERHAAPSASLSELTVLTYIDLYTYVFVRVDPNPSLSAQ